MADVEVPVDGDQEDKPEKKGKMGLVIGLVLAIVLGGGGFFAVNSGMIFGQETAHGSDGAHEEGAVEAFAPVAFVPLEPLVISLGAGSRSTHLRFRAELEVEPGVEDEVSKLSPRVMDVLNSYLRAIAVSDLEDPTSLINLRAQMLRRIQLVAGEGRVRDLLIMEFVLN